MKRVWGHVLAGISLAGGAVIFSPGCVHDDSTLFIQGVFAPETSSSEPAVCTYTPDPTEPMISSGALDIALRGTYDAIFLIGNQMVSEVNGSQLMTETSIVKVEGAIVRILSGTQQLGDYTRLAAGFVYPLSGSTPGYDVFGPVTIVDENTLYNVPADATNGTPIATYLSGFGSNAVVRVVSYIRVFGHSLGGDYVESSELEFPVDICDGCLVSYTNNPLYPLPNCVGLPGTASASTPAIPCLFGEDLTVDCSLCQGTAVCRGAVQTIPTPVADAGTD